MYVSCSGPGPINIKSPTTHTLYMDDNTSKIIVMIASFFSAFLIMRKNTEIITVRDIPIGSSAGNVVAGKNFSNDMSKSIAMNTKSGPARSPKSTDIIMYFNLLILPPAKIVEIRISVLFPVF